MVGLLNWPKPKALGWLFKIMGAKYVEHVMEYYMLWLNDISKEGISLVCSTQITESDPPFGWC